METAVPIDKYFIDIKKRLIEVVPAIALKISNLLFLPIIGILFFNKKLTVKKSDPKDLKKTISKVGIPFKYLTVEFMQAKAKVLINMYFMAFFTSKTNLYLSVILSGFFKLKEPINKKTKKGIKT